jgi:hypothetical protein
MTALNGHFDGKHIVLDDPVALKPNTRVKVIALEDGSSEAEIIGGCTRLSESVFQKIWDNPLDADYDNLWSRDRRVAVISVFRSVGVKTSARRHRQPSVSV